MRDVQISEDALEDLTLEQNSVVVWAVVDLRRSPEWVRKRLADQDGTRGLSQ